MFFFWPITAFFGFLLFFHLMLRFNVFCKALRYVDYVWLSIAFLGLLGVLVSNQAFVIRTELEYRIERLDKRIESYKQMSKTDLEASPQNEDYAKYIAALRRLFKHLNEHSSDCFEQAINDFRPDETVSNQVVANYYLPDLVELNSLQELCRRLRALDDRLTTFVDGQYMHFWFSPFLIAFAIALRLTKATYGLREDRKSESPAEDEEQADNS